MAALERGPLLSGTVCTQPSAETPPPSSSGPTNVRNSAGVTSSLAVNRPRTLCTAYSSPPVRAPAARRV